MSAFAQIGHDLDADAIPAGSLLAAGEQILEHWLIAHGQLPTTDKREGFRLLALHRQGSKGDPSFNACRETCRELAFYYNLITLEPGHPESAKRLDMMRFVARHLFYFISGKMEDAKLGDFCCSSRALRGADEARSA